MDYRKVLFGSVIFVDRAKNSSCGWRKGLKDVPTHTMVKHCNIISRGVCSFLCLDGFYCYPNLVGIYLDWNGWKWFVELMGNWPTNNGQYNQQKWRSMYVFTYSCIHVFTCIHVLMQACMYVCMCVCVYARIPLCWGFSKHMYIYNYIYTLHTQLSEREAMIENDEKVV